MLTLFTKITNVLSSLGDEIDHDQKVKKVIRALPKAWEVKKTTLRILMIERRWISPGLLGKSKPTNENESM